MFAGDVVRVDFGIPQGSEPGFERPAVVVTADAVLRHEPRTVHVVPLSTNVRRQLPTEVSVEIEGLQRSVAQCHLLTVVSSTRLVSPAITVVGAATLAQVRAIVGDLLDVA